MILSTPFLTQQIRRATPRVLRFVFSILKSLFLSSINIKNVHFCDHFFVFSVSSLSLSLWNCWCVSLSLCFPYLKNDKLNTLWCVWNVLGGRVSGIFYCLLSFFFFKLKRFLINAGCAWLVKAIMRAISAN